MENKTFDNKYITIELLDISELKFRRNYFKVMRKMKSLKKIKKYYTHKFLEIIYNEPLEIIKIREYIVDDEILVSLYIKLDYDTLITEPNNELLLKAVDYVRSHNKFCGVNIILH